VPSVLSAVGLPKAEALAKEGHKRRKGLEGEREPCVAFIDAEGADGGAVSAVWCSRGASPRF